MIIRSLIMLGCLVASFNSHAVRCVSGCNDVRTTINQNLSTSQNTIGRQIDSNTITTPALGMIATQNGGFNQWAKFLGDSIPNPNNYSATPVFHKVDDYISVAIARDSPCVGNTGTIYVPFNARVFGPGCSLPESSPGDGFNITPRDWYATIRIDKRIVSGTFTKNIIIGQFGFCQPFGCSSAQVQQNIYLSLNITVPQTCSINAGQTLTLDFGNISTGAFKTAGAKAESINPKTSTVAVTCDNIAAGTNLSLRLQGNTVSGNIIVSNNSDVGFIVTDTSDKILIPNNLNSTIPFYLDSNTRANATIKVYPASVTGVRPDEGPVTSQAFLRVDFP